ncbi:hypothetical protein DAPPUDRAFT_338203 [Daphnia pulex]|uniref:Uncharacterized protein n=1 Tax=Daphnia pulex TaxID=6669 RepID=E9I2L6_DAPPU|nr:hypothetical protein DAPPUDRAFT_338203 [Daphnia pulex]|eukprot:EFX61764.1 hypothetical protein DAPPUDRAFT_338203 [Daphnia pulex]
MGCVANSDDVDSPDKCLETIRDDVACLQAPPNDLGLIAGDFVLNLLAEQKMTQVNIKYVMDVGTNLLNEAVNRKLQEAFHLILENNFDPMSALSSLLDCKDKPFVTHQSTQNKYFVKHFGMIEAERITLPVQAADFGRHKTGKDQHFKPKK